MLVGRKGVNLARLIDAVFPVPDGFCITIAAFRELVDDESVDTLFEDLSELDPADTLRINEVRASFGESPRGCVDWNGVSGGVVEGNARIIHAPLEETIETGEILVTPSSDAGWMLHQ